MAADCLPKSTLCFCLSIVPADAAGVVAVVEVEGVHQEMARAVTVVAVVRVGWPHLQLQYRVTHQDGKNLPLT